MSGLTVLENIATRLPYGFVLDRAPVSAKPPTSPSLLSRVMNVLSARTKHRAAIKALKVMTDRELADIGLRRDDIPLVFDPAFAARHETARVQRLG